MTTQLDNHRIILELNEIGIDESKARVYLSCLGLGKATVLQIARHSGLKRTTVYEHIRFLVQKSLITEVFEKQKRYFVANSPKNLREFVKEKNEIVKQLVPELFSLYSALPSKPQVQYFHGQSGIREANDQMMESISKKVYYWVDVKDYFTTVGEEYYRASVLERVKRGIFAYGIWKTREEALAQFSPKRNMEELREIRIAPKDVVMDVYIQLYDNKVCIFSTKGEGYAIIIESKDLNRTMKYFFDTMWSISKQYK